MRSRLYSSHALFVILLMCLMAQSRRSAAGQRQSLPLSSSISRADSSERDSVYGPPSAYGNSRLYSRRPSQIATSGLGSYRDSSPVLSAGGRVDSVSRLDAYRSRYYTQKAAQPVPPGPKSPDYPTYGRRRPSITEDHISPPHRALHSAYRPSKLNNAYADLDSSPNADTPPEHGRKRALSRADAESVGSGHAPSAMYDELEDLKSRIRRIEILGKSPSAAGVGVQSSTSGSNERPRTATTTVTTISSSPKHNKLNRKSATSPPTTNDIAEHEAEGSASSNLHPLLHEALVRCKIVLKPGLYRIVDAAATEALEMASLTSSAGPQGTIFTAASIINGATVSDRQIRRKADNMCRTLTELCIALCENQGVSAGTRSTTEPNSPAVIQSIETRPGSKHGTPQADVTARDESPASETLPYQGYAGRSASLEPESVALQRSSPSRALSRIEARRTSLNVLGLGSASATNSPREARPPQQIDEDSPLAESDFPSQQQRISGVPSRFSRAGTSLLRARRRPNDEVDDDDPTLRPLSRAMTDAGARPNQLRIPTANTDKKRAHRLSREYVYTSDEPLPGQVPLRLSTAQLSGNGLRRVTSIQSQQSPLLRDNASIVGSADRRFYFDRPGPSTPFEGGERQRIPSMGTTYSSSRRNSAGLSLSRQLRGSTPKSVAVDGGAE